MIAEVRSGFLVLLVRSSRSDDHWREVELWKIIEIVLLVGASTFTSFYVLSGAKPEQILLGLTTKRFVQNRISCICVFAGVFSASVESLGA